MSYEEKLERVKQRILENVVSIVKGWYEGAYFHFQISDPHSVWELYIDEFKNEFGSLVTKDVETQLVSAGAALGFAVRAHESTSVKFNSKKLVDFVHTFVTIQFDDFDNWCGDIMMAMAEQGDVVEKVTDDPK